MDSDTAQWLGLVSLGFPAPKSVCEDSGRSTTNIIQHIWRILRMRHCALSELALARFQTVVPIN